jgi:hypothetical protein
MWATLAAARRQYEKTFGDGNVQARWSERAQGSPLKYRTAPLKAALKEYDSSKPARTKAWDDAKTDADVDAADAADTAALNKVREAFYTVTRDRNSRDSCMRVPLDFMRQVAKFKSGKED